MWKRDTTRPRARFAPILQKKIEKFGAIASCAWKCARRSFMLCPPMHQMDVETGHKTADARAGQLARSQYGIITREQALALGFTQAMIAARVKAGRWAAMHRGVYVIAGTPRTWRQIALAACRRVGEDADLSHRAAAAMFRFDAFPPGLIELTVPAWFKRAPAAARIHRLGPLDPDERTIIDGIPVTSAPRTLFDLASIHGLARAAGDAMDEAIRRHLVTPERLHVELDRQARAKRHGVRAFRELLTQRTLATPQEQSNLETDLARLLKGAGYKFEEQYPIYVDGREFFLDCAFPAERVGIEAEGYRWHSGFNRYVTDLERRTLIQSIGWTVLHFTKRDVSRRRAYVLATVERALANAHGIA